MCEDQDLYNEIMWVMRHYGSDAGERQEPGSKLVTQAKRIVEYVRQRELAIELLREHNLDLIEIARRSR